MGPQESEINLKRLAMVGAGFWLFANALLPYISDPSKLGVPIQPNESKTKPIVPWIDPIDGHIDTSKIPHSATPRFAISALCSLHDVMADLQRDTGIDGSYESVLYQRKYEVLVGTLEASQIVVKELSDSTQDLRTKANLYLINDSIGQLQKILNGSPSSHAFIGEPMPLDVLNKEADWLRRATLVVIEALTATPAEIDTIPAEPKLTPSPATNLKINSKSC